MSVIDGLYNPPPPPPTEKGLATPLWNLDMIGCLVTHARSQGGGGGRPTEQQASKSYLILSINMRSDYVCSLVNLPWKLRVKYMYSKSIFLQ